MKNFLLFFYMAVAVFCSGCITRINRAIKPDGTFTDQSWSVNQPRSWVGPAGPSGGNLHLGFVLGGRGWYPPVPVPEPVVVPSGGSSNYRPGDYNSRVANGGGYPPVIVPMSRQAEIEGYRETWKKYGLGSPPGHRPR